VPGADPTTVWFGGEILQGDLSLPLPGDYWICACKRPWSATLGAGMAFPLQLGDRVYRINPGSTISYTEYWKGTNGQWSPYDPTNNYAEPFWSWKTNANEWLYYWRIP